MSGNSLVIRSALLAVAVFSSVSYSHAQEAFKTFKQLDSTAKMPKLNAFSPGFGETAGKAAAKSVRFAAKLSTEGGEVKKGLAWRVFSPIPGADGKLPLVASAEGGAADFQLTPGDYFVNVAFGRAGVTKKLSVPEDGEIAEQVLVLDAGGLVLNAVSGTDTRIAAKDLKFSVYSGEVRDDGDRGLVLADVKPNTIIRLNAGTYQILSEYGDINADVRADIKVEAGKLTQATMQHRAAQVTLKLVSDAGGEAIADTAWSVLTSSGDIVAESVSAYPQLILAEGEYTAIARNKEKIYQKDFRVQSGRNADVELMLTR